MVDPGRDWKPQTGGFMRILESNRLLNRRPLFDRQAPLGGPESLDLVAHAKAKEGLSLGSMVRAGILLTGAFLPTHAYGGQQPPTTGAPRVIEQVTVFFEPVRFGGWPANHGIWVWGNEIVVGFGGGFAH